MDRQRASVFLIAKIASPDGGSETYRARNLSRQGVCLERPDTPEPGTKLIVSIGLVEQVEAEVIWSRDGLVGVQFAEPIDTALARKRPQQSMDPREGWGRVIPL